MGEARHLGTPIPLPTSPLKGEEKRLGSHRFRESFEAHGKPDEPFCRCVQDIPRSALEMKTTVGLPAEKPAPCDGITHPWLLA